MQLCYIEDCLGGTICRKEHKDLFLQIDESAKLCFEGTKEELENYLGYDITEDNISYIGE